MGAKIQLTGQRFGRLTVVAQAPTKKVGRVLWECRCECGKTRVILANSLLMGHTKSCGCIRIEQSRINFTKKRSTEQRAA